MAVPRKRLSLNKIKCIYKKKNSMLNFSIFSCLNCDQYSHTRYCKFCLKYLKLKNNSAPYKIIK